MEDIPLYKKDVFVDHKILESSLNIIILKLHIYSIVSGWVTFGVFM